MKIVSLLFFFSIQLFAMGCDNDLPKEIFKHWTHSYEDDTKDVEVFRPSYYNFPPARGRRGFEIKENGELVQYKIGPTDRVVEVSGRWKAEGKDKIIVSFENKEIAPFTIQIISCTDDMLKIKRRST